MIICNRSQANNLINDPSNFLRLDDRNISESNHVIFEELPVKGRGLGRKNLTDEERASAAREAINGKQNSDAARDHNISQSSLSAYKNGATSTATYHEKNEALSKSNDEVKIVIAGQVKNKLLQTLEAITPDKINNAKLGELTNLAHGMSNILKSVEPDDENRNKKDGPSFIFMVPEQRKEDSYKVIDLHHEAE